MMPVRGLPNQRTLLPVADPIVELEDEAIDRTRALVGVVTASKCLASVEFRIRLDTVEVWYREHCCAVFEREKLRLWLASPWRWLSEDEVVFSVDPRSQGDRIAISLVDGDGWAMNVEAWTLSVKDFRTLRERV